MTDDQIRGDAKAKTPSHFIRCNAPVLTEATRKVQPMQASIETQFNEESPEAGLDGAASIIGRIQ